MCIRDRLNTPSKLKLHGRTELGVGETIVPAVSATNKGAGVGAYALSSSDPGVLAVDGNRVTAAAPGTAKLSVRNYNKKSASLNFTVRSAPSSVHFNAEAPVLGVGQTYTPSASVNEGAAGAIDFLSLIHI